MMLRGGFAAAAAALIVALSMVAPSAAPAATISCTTPPAATVRMNESKVFTPSCSGYYAGTVIDHHPAHGTLDHEPFGFGALRYTPDPDYVGPDSFDYHAQDGAGYHTQPITQQVTVASDVNTAPTCGAPSSTPTVRQGTPKQITLSCSDSDGDTLTVEITSAPSRGTVSTPAKSGFSYVTTYTVTNPGGDDSFSFRARDDRGASSEIRTQTVKAVTADYNTAPQCTDQSRTVRAGEQNGFPTWVCTDADGDPLMLQIVAVPAKGTANASSSGIGYKADLNAAGADSFTFTASDDFTTAPAATVSLTIDAPQPPSCTEQTDPVGYTGQSTTIRLRCAPGGDGFPVTITIDDAPDHDNGTWARQSSTDSTADYVYHPVDGYRGPDSITWRGTGPDGLTSGPRTFSFTVQDPPANRPPACSGPAETTVRNNTTRTLTFSCVDHDPGDDNVLEVVQDPAHGQVTGIDSSNDGYLTFTYDPTDTYEGRDSFSVRVRDGRGGTSSTFSVGVDVLRADYNRAPSCLANGGFTTRGGTNAWDRLCRDADGDPVTYAITSDPAHGTASVESGGTVVRYTATDPDFQGYDTFTLTASDDHGGVRPWTFQVQVGQPPMGGGGPVGGGGGGGGGGSARPTAPETDAAAPPGDPAPVQPAPSRPSAPSIPAPSSSRPIADVDLGPGATAFLTHETTDGIVAFRGTAPAPLLVLRCEQRCSVQATPELILSGARARAARTLRLKAQRMAIAPGGRAIVKLRLTRAQRAAIRRARTARVRLSLTVRKGDGRTVRDRTAFRIALR